MDFPRISEKWENCRKITDESRGFFIFSPPFRFSRQRYDALQILVGRGTSSHFRPCSQGTPPARKKRNSVAHKGVPRGSSGKGQGALRGASRGGFRGASRGGFRGPLGAP